MSATGKIDERGFTLIEMLVVLAILGLVASIGYPAVDRALAGQRFAQAVAGVEGQLHAARASAIATSRPQAFKPQDVAADVTLDYVGGPPVFFADGSARGEAVTVGIGKRRQRFAIDADTGEIARLP